MPELWNQFSLGDAILIAAAFIVGRLYEADRGITVAARAAYHQERARLAAESDHAREVEHRAMQLAARRRTAAYEEDERAHLANEDAKASADELRATRLAALTPRRRENDDA